MGVSDPLEDDGMEDEPGREPLGDDALGDEADTAVDITDSIEAKIAALRCHESQIHDWPVDEWVKARAKDRGAPYGVEYAETFRTFRLKDD